MLYGTKERRGRQRIGRGKQYACRMEYIKRAVAGLKSSVVNCLKTLGVRCRTAFYLSAHKSN